MDSPYRPPTYGAWPYNVGMHCRHPSEFHCCCNHTYHPDHYSFKPPLPQELPPPHLYYHGPFPQHANAFPSQFFPPHTYPVDQMPYGYDKLKSHCCGCPNHVCHGAEKGNMKIEEERPDVKLENEHKDADSGSIIHHPNNQFPFVWRPPASIQGKENGKHYKLSPHLVNGWAPMSRKMTGDVEQREQDNQLNVWAPMSCKRTGDVTNQEQNQGKEQFHWPIVWMPAEYDEPKQKAKDMKMEEAPRSPKIKVIPLSWFDNNGHHDQKPATRDGSGDHTDRAVNSQLAVPEHQDGLTVEESPKSTPAVPKKVNDDERKPARENYKAIPVMPEKEIGEKKASTYRTIPVMKESDQKNTGMSGKKEVAKASNVDKVEESLQGDAVQENAGAESFKGCDERQNEDMTVVKNEAAKDEARTFRSNLSEPDAAVRIQSAYRGYDVRRWQPLDKLREIRNVYEQMQGVKKQLRCIEDTCKKPTEKEQVAIGETIMNFLLKLDTIQGLHPSVREARKSVARELVSLQEKLDTLCKQPSGEFDCKNSNEKSEIAENSSHIVAPIITTEICDKEERAVELGKVEEPSSVDSMEACDAVPSGIPMEVKQDADASEQKNGKEESYSTIIEEANKGKVPGHFELEVSSSMDMSSEEHSNGIMEHKIEESNDVSVGQVTECCCGQQQKPAIKGEGEAVPCVKFMEPLHDAASAGDSSGLEQCTATTDQSLHAESNSAPTEDIITRDASASVENGATTEEDGPVDGQLHRTAAAESLGLKHDVSSEDQPRELSGQVCLEDSSLSLQGEEQHDIIPADDSVLSCTKDQSDAASDISMQDQAVDTMQDSRVANIELLQTPDGTPGASMDNIELSASAEPDSASEQIVVDESNDAVHCGVSAKDEQRHEDQKTEATVGMLRGSSAGDRDSLPEASKKECDIQESHPSLEEEADDTMDEIVLPQLDSFELSRAHEGGITGHERSETDVSSESQTDTQEEHTDVVLPETGRCIETLKEAPVDAVAQEEHEGVAFPDTSECIETLKEAPVDTSAANSVEDVGVQVSVTGECTEMPENSAEDVGVQAFVTEKCTEMLEDVQMGVSGANSADDAGVQVSATGSITKDAPVRGAGVNPAEEEAHNLKGDNNVQTENQASEAASSSDGRTEDGLQDGDKKKLAEENQQLKELLQKLLASGNDQMGVITDLSDKVEALERKLARKKRPKVRVHRPARNAMAKVH
ncbi:hypothetical protein HU200_046889 [Digitaria exilis]|uniref:BAG domain-containing protein n=1 Tax=Digitaria exilis TaxID=1010633 RepID=A0A835EC54_9POAL|nr:hypothetical protein HU200_046889 [Digitaria exilis]